MKIPVLLHHYIEHLNESNNESFADFLSEHYANNITHSDSNQHHDHEKLPFKANDCATIFMLVANTNQTTHFSIGKTFFACEKVLNAKITSFISSSVFNSIWQPPKFQ
ncbi:MAG TPA: hypothetical protein VGB95_00050 [Chitinophagales bacterium]